MTKTEKARKFFMYLGIVNGVIYCNYIVAFLAIILSIATGRLELTTISIWSVFCLFIIDRYLQHMLHLNYAEINDLIKIVRKE
jgi:hypothetical protein